VKIEVSIHPKLTPATATVNTARGTHWLSITSGCVETTIYAGADQAEALKMMADIFNDAFAKKTEAATE